MPPKRTTKKSTVAPVAKRPTREAKTRSAATTASLYKDSEAYRNEDSLSDISDPISDIGSDSLEGLNDSDQEETFTRTRGGRTKKAPASGSNTTSSSINKRGAAATTSAKKARPLKNTSSPAGSTSGATSTSGSKRKASELKFSPIGMSSSSSQSSPSMRSLSNTSISSSLAGVSVSAEDQWAEKYAPKSIDEVVVHKNKIGDVREWLRIYTSPFDTRRDTSGGAILVLTGPAGSGKTAVLRNLAKEMDLNIVEWINSINANNIIQRPTMPDRDKEAWRPASVDEEYVPVMKSFQEFFSRAHRFNPLQLSSGKPQQTQTTGFGNLNSSSPVSSTGWMQTARSGPTKKNIILIEDLPPVSAVSSRKIFQDTITNFANSRASSSSVLVIIVSDVFSKQSTELQFSSTRESSDPAMTMRTLLPSSILNRLDSGAKNDNARIRQIKFNPIAPTFVKKALKTLTAQEFRGKTAYAPETAEIDNLIQIHDGDLRAVINALQFLCYLPAKRRRQFREASRILEEDQEGLGTLEERSTQGQDSSLGIFHAVAKVLYNKRDWSGPLEEFDRDIVKVPANAWSKGRPPLPFNPEKDLIEKLPIEPDLYTLMLHQNYVRHMGSIDECMTAMNYLCIADQFQSHPSFGNAGYTQTMQMQPYMTSLAVRGMLFAPTSAGPASASSFGGPKKHWWPELFAVNRTARANDDMFSEVAADLAGREAHGLATGSVTGPGFIPKAVVRQELVPMLHRCLIMDPYRPIFQQLLRSSSKAFVRHGAGAYGTKVGIIKKEFGEGDEGFVEELDVGAGGTQSSSGVADEITNDNVGSNSQGSGARSESGFGTGFGRGKQTAQQQRHEQRTRIDPSVVDDDPIESFSD